MGLMRQPENLGNLEADKALLAHAEKGDLDGVLAALSAGAWVDFSSDMGETALHSACLGGHAACAKALIDAGADTHARVASNETALSFAAGADSPDCVAALLRGGAIPIEVAGIWSNEFDAALRADSVDCARLLKPRRLPQAVLDELVQSCASHGSPRCLSLALEWGGSATLVDAATGRAPLAAAAEARRGDGPGSECIRILLDAGAPPNQRLADHAHYVWEATALMLATQHGYQRCVSTLLAGGADPNIRAKDGNTALTLAASQGQRCLSALLAAGAIVDARADNGRTALIMAAFGDHIDCLVKLLEAGADTEARCNSGQSAFDLALAYRNMDCLNILEAWSQKKSIGEHAHEPGSAGKAITPRL